MSARFSSLSRASRKSLCRYSKSCFNTVNDGLNFLQIAVDAPGDVASGDALSHHLLLDDLDFSEILIDQYQVLRVLLTQATGCNCFYCHGFSVSIAWGVST